MYVRDADRDALPALPAHFEVAAEEAPGYSIAELTGFAWRIFRDRLDLFHATHYVLPPLPKTRAVVTIHDIIHLLYPQFLPNRAAHLYARFMIRRALQRADRIITVSYNSKRDLTDYFGIPGRARRSSTTASPPDFRRTSPSSSAGASPRGTGSPGPTSSSSAARSRTRTCRTSCARSPRRAGGGICLTGSCSRGRCRRTPAGSRR